MILFKEKKFPDMERFSNMAIAKNEQRYERLCGHRDGKK
jgi:hypothetical protein